MAIEHCNYLIILYDDTGTMGRHVISGHVICLTYSLFLSVK